MNLSHCYDLLTIFQHFKPSAIDGHHGNENHHDINDGDDVDDDDQCSDVIWCNIGKKPVRQEAPISYIIIMTRMMIIMIMTAIVIIIMTTMMMMIMTAIMIMKAAIYHVHHDHDGWLKM